MPRLTAVYLRVGGRRRGSAGQEADLDLWAAAQPGPVAWYRDAFVGSPARRPTFERLYQDIEGRSVARVAFWRVDRLALTPKGLTTWFAACRRRRVTLVSLREGWESATPGGRLASGCSPRSPLTSASLVPSGSWPGRRRRGPAGLGGAARRRAGGGR